MKKTLLILLATGLFFSACNSSNQTSTTGTGNSENAPVMKFEKTTHDFGKLKVGDTITYNFKFSNTGKSPLIITDAYASCGCTKPEWPKAPLKPGENGNIHVTFRSRGKTPGLQDKIITIIANTQPSENKVHLIGELTPN